MAKLPPPVRPRAISPEVTESVKSVTPEPVDVESRRVVNMMCNVKPREESCELLVSDELRNFRSESTNFAFCLFLTLVCFTDDNIIANG